MTEIKVFDSSSLDYTAYVELQRRAFAEVFEKNKVDPSYLNEDFFRWKYSTPARPARIAAVFEDGEMVAANAMLPALANDRSGGFLTWQSCDTATAPKARGKGYFKKCLKSLLEVIRPEEIFFGFPNHNSIHGFLGIGWSELDILSTYVKPLLPWGSKLPAGVQLVTALPAGYEDLVARWSKDRTPMIGRTRDYMTWRFFQHPLKHYACFVKRGSTEGELRGLVICRQAEVMGRNVGLVMELIAEDAGASRDLHRAAESWARSRGCRFMFEMNNSHEILRKLWEGYFKIPTFLLPKRQVFMGSAASDARKADLKRKWCLTLGDWDGF
jgi:GNAT superfamily N-acetyltransferase